MSDFLVGFIVLNYQTYELTKTCVDSILKLHRKGCDVKIVIVDNSSKDGSGKKLKEVYQENDSVYVIMCDKNVGFAEGNNQGFYFIKQHFDANFVVTTNSDVVFVQKSFLIILFRLYEKNKFWVAGPDIYVKDRFFHQNPSMHYDSKLKTQGYTSIDKINCYIKKWNNELEHMKKADYYALYKYVREKYRKTVVVKLFFFMKNLVFRDYDYKLQKENVCLQGSCLIFDSRYIRESINLFTPLTFLYLEEQILQLDCYIQDRNMIYFPQLRVEHIDCGTAVGNKGEFKEFCKRNMIRLRRMIDSCYLYKRYFNEKVGTLYN